MWAPAERQVKVVREFEKAPHASFNKSCHASSQFPLAGPHHKVSPKNSLAPQLIPHTVSHSVRVVIDTNVIVSGLRSTRGAAFRLLRGVRNGLVRPIVTVPVFLEYEDVLLRPGILPDHMPRAAVPAFLTAFLALSECREVHFRWRPWLPDPKDECLLEAALAAGAIPIVTHNVRDFCPVSQLGIRVFTPIQFVSDLNLP